MPDRPATAPRAATAAGVIAAGVMAVLLGVGLLAGSTSGASRRPVGAVPDVALDAIIHTDQLDLVTRAPGAVVATTMARLTRDASALARDGRIFARDRSEAAAAGRARGREAVAVTNAARAVRVATEAHDRAVRVERLERSRLRALAVGWYTGGAEVDVGPATSVDVSQRATDADEELLLITAMAGRTLGDDTTVVSTTHSRLEAATSVLDRAHSELATAVTVLDDSGRVLAAAGARVGLDRSTAATAGTALAAAKAALARAVSTFDGTEGGGRHPVPSILGPSVLTAPQLVAWFESMGYAVGTRTDIAQLASWYVSEGAAEGVRGDIAFAQAVVETGEFDSPDAVQRNNYAGIGHCDSCGGGLRLPSPLGGVRTQIQLLRTYADPTLTTADLPSPPPVAALAPEDQTRRGCCETWNSLTGVWASDETYGRTVLEVYAEMLAYTVARQAAPPGG